MTFLTAPSSPFRKAALDRLASPEQLDRMVTVTSARGWLALLVLCLLILAGLAWSIVGTLPTYARADGILLRKTGKVVANLAAGNGVLAEFLVKTGDPVTTGQVIARIDHREVEEQYRNAVASVEERERLLARARADAEHELAVKNEESQREKAALDVQETAVRGLLEVLRHKLADEEALFADKVVTRQVVLQTRQSVNQTNQELATVATRKAQIDIQTLDTRLAAEQRVREAQRQLAEAQRRSAESQALHDTTAVVTAAATGTVAEIQANPGARIAAGQNLLTIETGEDRLELLLFAAPADGDRIKPGMAVLVSPSQVPREEFGTLSGTVATVSELPTTTEGMKAILHNDELIRGFQRSGVPFLVRVALEADPQSVSGYRWSSRRGRSITLSSGTLASGEITIRRQAPITLLIPLLRRNTGL